MAGVAPKVVLMSWQEQYQRKISWTMVDLVSGVAPEVNLIQSGRGRCSTRGGAHVLAGVVDLILFTVVEAGATPEVDLMNCGRGRYSTRGSRSNVMTGVTLREDLIYPGCGRCSTRGSSRWGGMRYAGGGGS